MKSIGRADEFSLAGLTAILLLLAVVAFAHSWLNWLQLVNRNW
jgi:hypothetical protein